MMKVRNHSRTLSQLLVLSVYLPLCAAFAPELRDCIINESTLQFSAVLLRDRVPEIGIKAGNSVVEARDLASAMFRSGYSSGTEAIVRQCYLFPLSLASISLTPQSCRFVVATAFTGNTDAALDIQTILTQSLGLQSFDNFYSSGLTPQPRLLTSPDVTNASPHNSTHHNNSGSQHGAHNSSHTVAHTIHAAHHHDGQLALLSPFVALTFGALCSTGFLTGVLTWLRIPYTSLLLLAGCAFGLLYRFVDLGSLGVSVSRVAGMEPHLLLYIFLPPLIFESAFSIEFHTFKRCQAHILLLAAPGVLLASGLTGGCLYLLYPTWSPYLLFLTGTVLSATDPVAVVALLKELGAKKSLATLIEGESLLNDGTAVVFFTVLLAAVQAGGVMADSPSGVAWTFLRMAVGGPLFGLLFAAAFVEWIGRVFNSPQVEVTLTVCCAYLTFFVAEYYLRVSGVLAVVVAGLYFGEVGRTRISPEVDEFLREFWEVLAYMANSLIFLLTGIIISSKDFGPNIGLPDLWALLLLYAAITAARAAVFGLLFPLLHRTGYCLSWKEVCVCIWGGLRGAVGLALALVVSLDPTIPASLGDKVLFHTAGIVMLTLLVNATTVKALVQALGLDRVRASKEVLFLRAMRELEERGQREENALKVDSLYSAARWADVRKFKFKVPKAILEADMDSAEAAAAAEAGGGGGNAQKKAAAAAVVAVDGGENGEQISTTQLHHEQEARRRFLVTLKASYWKQFTQGLVGRGAVLELLAATDHALDRDCALDDWGELRQLFEVSRFSKLMHLLARLPLLGRLAARAMSTRLQHGYDVASTFVVAREEATKLLSVLLEHDPATRGRLLPGAQKDLEAAREVLYHIQRSLPEVAASITTVAAARRVLNVQRSAVMELHEEGMLDSGETARVRGAIEAQMKRLLYTPPSMELPSKDQLLHEIPWLGQLEPQSFARVRAAATEVVMEEGDLIVEQGHANGNVFVIARGTVAIVQESSGPGMPPILIDQLGVGSFIGELGWLTQGVATATAQATSPVVLLEMKGKALNNILQSKPEAFPNIWKSAGGRIAERMLVNIAPYDSWDFRRLRRWVVSQWELLPGVTPISRSLTLHRHCVLLLGMADVYPLTNNAAAAAAAADAAVIDDADGSGAAEPEDPLEASVGPVSSSDPFPSQVPLGAHRFVAPCILSSSEDGTFRAVFSDDAYLLVPPRALHTAHHRHHFHRQAAQSHFNVATGLQRMDMAALRRSMARLGTQPGEGGGTQPGEEKSRHHGDGVRERVHRLTLTPRKSLDIANLCSEEAAAVPVAGEEEGEGTKPRKRTSGASVAPTSGTGAAPQPMQLTVRPAEHTAAAAATDAPTSSSSRSLLPLAAIRGSRGGSNDVTSLSGSDGVGEDEMKPVQQRRQVVGHQRRGLVRGQSFDPSHFMVGNPNALPSPPSRSNGRRQDTARQLAPVPQHTPTAIPAAAGDDPAASGGGVRGPTPARNVVIGPAAPTNPVVIACTSPLASQQQQQWNPTPRTTGPPSPVIRGPAAPGAS